MAALALLVGSGALVAQGKIQRVSRKLVDRAEDTLTKLGEAEKELNKVTDRNGKLLSGKKRQGPAQGAREGA